MLQAALFLFDLPYLQSRFDVDPGDEILPSGQFEQVKDP